ncbi:MAG: hypothetical protein E7070_07325 [Bacteroidales bacterium]|jgi:hypothetical protein|nr:hypothetical protein [Bacteroidales bacterium]
MRKNIFLTSLIALQCTFATADVVWFDGQSPITYSVPRKVEPVVQVALDMWKSDMEQVTGLTPKASAKAKIRVVENKKLATDGFRIATQGDQILVEGGNARGMAYGLLELSRMAGVSPWIWWGDVVPEHRDKLVMADDFRTEQQPSVAYRGIFINDEDWTLRPWSSTTYEPSTKLQIGVQTYKRIFQLLLRLRANAIWPAMHEGTTAFFQLPGAKAVADSCGIVIGTSHCEPMLRNNVGEWDVARRGSFNYKTNREAVQQYWTERLREVANSGNNMFTIGMRGIHDGSMEGFKSADEKREGLQQVIDDQQRLLRDNVGDPTRLMQVFVPYKEVLQLYENGLRVPDYVTLMWCDDNYGYITRLSTPDEQRRSGGGGIYYHLSYWGRPHDYLWLTTTQPGLIYNEMRAAYDHNVRRLWIANVHDPKAAGYDLELFLDLAWNIDCTSAATLNDHYRRWLCREFGNDVGQRLFPVMHEYYRLCAMRRPEFMGWNQTELDKRLYDRGLSPVRNSDWPQEQCDWFEDRFLTLSREVETIGRDVRPALSDAYFATIQYPVQAAAAQAEKMFEAQRARKLANGRANHIAAAATDSLLRESVARSQAAYGRIRSLTDHYNNQLAGGKWHGLMNDHPRDLPVYWAPLLPSTTTDAAAASTATESTSADTPLTLSNTLITNACDFASATNGAQPVQMLGHSMQAVALPKDGAMTYRFDVAREGNYEIRTMLIPTQPNDNGDLRYSVSIDDGTPETFSLKEPFRSEQWKLNVLRGQTVRSQQVHLTAGQHSLTIRAIDDHIVVDQWMLSRKK